MNSNKRKLALLPLALLVLSSATPVMAHAEGWRANWQEQQNNAFDQAVEKNISDKQIEQEAVNNEQQVLTNIQQNLTENGLSDIVKNDLQNFESKAQSTLSQYQSRLNQASDKFTGNNVYIQDREDSYDDLMGPNIIQYIDNSDSRITSSKITRDQIENFLDVLSDQDDQTSQDTTPVVAAPTTSSTSDNNDNSQAIAKLEKEVADLQQAVSNKKKSTNSTLSSDKKLLAKLNKKMHRKHLSKKAQHKLALQRKALLKAIQKLTK